MLNEVRERLGSAALAVGVVALVVALAGGAYAASNSGDGSKATASAKGKRGPRGPKGPQGAPGVQGPIGATGASGAKGDKGDQGDQGDQGENGNSAVVTPIPLAAPKCGGRGGIEVKVGTGGGNEVCNGIQGVEGPGGPPGPQGDPWTPEPQLPPGASETGAWAFTGSEADVGGIVVPISFTLPVAALNMAAHYQTEGDFDDSCPGDVNTPTAEPEQLCVYFNDFFGLGAPVNATFEAISPLGIATEPGAREEGVSSTGAALYFGFSGDPGQAAYGIGSWAVAAEAPAP